MSSSKEPSLKTRRKVYHRWRGKCAFCGKGFPVEEHHIVAKSDDPSLIDDPNNLILLCRDHHGLTLKKKPDGTPSLSFIDIQDLEKSKFAKANKRGFYFPFPQNFHVYLGNNYCCLCPYILIVNGKPLIELWPQKPVAYADKTSYYLYMRFFDEENNFVGGMFANHWASVVDEQWKFDYNNSGYDYEMLEVRHRKKPINVKFERYSESLYITGRFYFDSIEILANHNALFLTGSVWTGNFIRGCEVAFMINGNSESASVSCCGRLT